LTQAPPSSDHTAFICGMFGIGTPPALALPNASSVALRTALRALVFAGGRWAAAASADCEEVRDM
jgi:hypothetical protein